MNKRSRLWPLTKNLRKNRYPHQNWTRSGRKNIMIPFMIFFDQSLKKIIRETLFKFVKNLYKNKKFMKIFNFLGKIWSPSKISVRPSLSLILKIFTNPSVHLCLQPKFSIFGCKKGNFYAVPSPYRNFVLFIFLLTCKYHGIELFRNWVVGKFV